MALQYMMTSVCWKHRFPASAHSREHTKKIIHAAASSSSALEAVHAVSVVDFPLVLIEQDVVSSLDLLELY